MPATRQIRNAPLERSFSSIRSRVTPVFPVLLRRTLATLCILLILVVGAAHLLHSHPANAPAEANCSLCVVAHLAASPAPAVAGPAIDLILRAMPPPEQILAAADSTVPAFHIRPPPAL